MKSLLRRLLLFLVNYAFGTRCRPFIRREGNAYIIRPSTIIAIYGLNNEEVIAVSPCRFGALDQ